MEEVILNLIKTHEIKEQSELLSLLKEQGINVAQATLSRRLKKLSIEKIGGIYKEVSFYNPNVPTALSIKVSEFGMILLQTYPGHAQALAYHFDNKYVTNKENQKFGILGTIAGDDTILLIMKNKSTLNRCLKLLEKIFPYAKID